MSEEKIKACRCNKCGKTYDSVWEYQSCDFGGCRGTIMPASGDREPAVSKTPDEKHVGISDLLSGSPTYPIVLDFGKRMEAKLARNRHKGDRDGWINDDPFALLGRIVDETGELRDEMQRVEVYRHEIPFVTSEQYERLANEAADIANFAMMVADWYAAKAR